MGGMGRMASTVSVDAEVIRLTKDIISNHFSRNDAAVAEHLDSNVLWIGPYDFQWTETAEEFSRIASYGFDEQPCLLTHEEYRLLAHDATFWVVYGVFVATGITGDKTLVSTKTRLTFLWKKEGRHLKVLHMHVSNAQDFSLEKTIPYDPAAVGGFFDYIAQFPAPRSTEGARKCTFKATDKSIHSIFPDEVTRVESTHQYCTLFLVNGTNFVVRSSLADVQKALGDRFVRAHRSHVVNAAYVQGCRNMKIRMADGTVVPAARDKYRLVKQAAESCQLKRQPQPADPADSNCRTEPKP